MNIRDEELEPFFLQCTQGLVTDLAVSQEQVRLNNLAYTYLGQLPEAKQLFKIKCLFYF